MFIEVIFITCMLLVFNKTVVINVWILLFLLFKRVLLLPRLSLEAIKIERTVTLFDKIRLLLLILTVFSIIIIFMRNADKPYLFYFLNKILLVRLIIVFILSNFLLFYFFFEVTIIPTIIIILIWGYQPERLQAAFYFFFYTILASLPLLVFIVFVINKTKCGTIIFSSTITLSNVWWAAAILAFLVKFPIFFFHLWLPKAHVEAPLGGSIILAAVLLKLGGIGIFRIARIFKHFVYSSLVSAVRIWGRVLTAIICLQQRDIKAIIAYSSVGHISFLISGIFLGSEVGINGRILIIFFHGLSSAALFILAKIVYDFSSSRALVLNKGKINLFPIFSLFWACLIVINIGVPPARRFWSEIFLLFGLTFKRVWFYLLFFFNCIFFYCLFLFLNN